MHKDPHLLLSALVKLIAPVANGSPIEVAHAFRRVKFYLLTHAEQIFSTQTEAPF